MKKRYLSMLMAVVLCLGLFTTGALAASGEVEAAAPAENAEPGETTQTQALDGEIQYNAPTAGVVIEGFGGKVVYSPPRDFDKKFWLGLP